MSHWLTNRGKLLLLQGAWDDDTSGAIKVGLLAGASVPTSIDTEAEVQDIATLSALLALSGVAEPTAGWYTGAGSAGRVSLVRSNATQDDTNNRVNMDAGNITYSGATAGTNLYGGFWADCTTDTNDTTRQLGGLFIFSSVIPTNGSDIVLNINDLIRGS